MSFQLKLSFTFSPVLLDRYFLQAGSEEDTSDQRAVLVEIQVIFFCNYKNKEPAPNKFVKEGSSSMGVGNFSGDPGNIFKNQKNKEPAPSQFVKEGGSFMGGRGGG